MDGYVRTGTVLCVFLPPVDCVLEYYIVLWYAVLCSAGLCFGPNGPVGLKHSEPLFFFSSFLFALTGMCPVSFR